MMCVMLLVFLGFAHKPIVASAAPLPVMASFVLPDGTIASLCLSDHDGKQGKHVDTGCEVCRLASSFAIPAPPAEVGEIVRSPTVAAFAFAAESLDRLNFPPNAPPRGPPSIPLSFQMA